MYYYNQQNYANVPYDNPSTAKKENIKTSGCGVVAACIVFNNLAGKELYTVKQMAAFALKHKARDNGGTNMFTLLDALCKANKGFSYKTTSSVSTLEKHLKAGGMAIANQGDAYNVFSTAGHYVVCYKMVGANIEVVDPQMYSGKYDSYSRPQRIVKKTANGCIVTPKELSKATADRKPAYYLVTYTKPKATKPTPTKPTTKKTVTEIAKEVINGKWGVGTARKQKLEKAGYNYNEVQKEVNKLLKVKSVDTVAREVINGKWGVGTARKNRLEKAGYNYNEVQKRVNELLKKGVK